MPDIIAAKCDACGNVVKVPVSYGGKKARCPKCKGVISIPTPSDSTAGLVSDDMLPEVARDDDPYNDTDDPPEAPAAPPPVPSAPRPRKAPTGSTRRGSSSRIPIARGETTRHRPRAGRRSSSAPVIAIIVIVFVAIIVVIAITASGGKEKSAKKGPAPAPIEAAPSEASLDLQARCSDYLQTVNRGDLIKVMRFHSASPEPDRALRGTVARILENGVQYQKVFMKSAQAGEDSGSVRFVCDYVTKAGGVEPNKEITLRWKRSGGEWLLADGP